MGYLAFQVIVVFQRGGCKDGVDRILSVLHIFVLGHLVPTGLQEILLSASSTALHGHRGPCTKGCTRLHWEHFGLWWSNPSMYGPLPSSKGSEVWAPALLCS